MAETAAVVCGQDQMVLHPNAESGCPLADFAQFDAVQRAWEDLREAEAKDLIPVTYVNSSAEVKAFCGCKEGMICTSQILSTVKDAPSGTSFSIGTERNMVERLDREHQENAAFPLRQSVCIDMAKIDTRHLLYTLERLVAGESVNVVRLPRETAHWANLAWSAC